MAFYPPPDEILPIFNPANFQTQANTGDEDIPFLTQYFLRFPTSQGSETVAGTLVSQQQLTANTNIVMDGTALTNYLEFPDGTQQFTAGTSGGGGTTLLNGDNDWTGTNTFAKATSLTGGGTTITIANDASATTDIATTAFVQNAIQNALNPIVPPPNPTSISYTFDGSVFSETFLVPATALSYNISIGSCGGRCGANAYDPLPNTGASQIAMYAGGQGGGGQQNSNTWNEPSPDYTLQPAEMAGQTITIFNTGHGVGTSCGFSYTQSVSGLPITCSLNNGGDGGDASVGTSGSAGAGATYSSPPSFSNSWTPNYSPAEAGAQGGSNLAVNATSVASSGVPYAPLNPPYTGPTVGVFYGNPASGQFIPFPANAGTPSGANGMGQIYSAVETPSTLVCDGVFGYNASPVGAGYLTIDFFYTSQGAIGGTNASFIAYDDPDPATKTKQIYTDKEGLVVAQDLTTIPKTTTLTPTNLTQDLNSVVSTALIADIIAIANAGTPNLDEVLTEGNTSNTAILIQDQTNPATLFTQMSHISFSATDATGSPQNDASVSASNIFVSNTNGDSNTLTAGNMAIDNTTSTTTYSIGGIDAGNQSTSISYSIASNQTTNTGYGKIELISGDLTSVPPRAVLQAFVDLNASPVYVANCNSIDLGGANGEELLIANGNSDAGLAIAYNTITMFSDSTPVNSFIQLQSLDAGTSAGSSLILGQLSFNLIVNNQNAITINNGFTDPVIFRRNISTTTNTGAGQPVGMLENSVANATTTGTTTLTISNAFATIINTPTNGTRVFVLPAPTAGTTGYWYAVCNKSTAFTIAVQYPAATLIATIPVAPNATNGGSVVRFAVATGGASYFTVN